VELVFCHTGAVPVLREVEQGGIAMRRIITRVEDADFLAAELEGQYLSTKPDQVAGEISFLELLQFGDEEEYPEVEVTPDDPAVFQYSGGTTGTPKGAIGLHRNLVANTIQFRTWLAGMQDGQETVLTAIPLYHVYGMVIAMSMGIAIGARLILILDPRNFTDLLEKIERYRPSIFPGVPGLYHGINQHADVQAGKYDLSSIQACISGSAPLLRDVKERFETLTGGKLVEGYGLSEAPTATHCNPLLGENRIGSIGLPLPDVEARIVDLEAGWKDVPIGTPGELIVRGPQIMAGYHNRPEENLLAVRDGWLYTGDVARMDADGYFYLVDRLKEVIKAGGYQVWPREVEEVIVQHPAVLETGVAGVIRPGRGETVKAWVVLKPGATCTSEEIQWWCEQQLVQYKTPTEVEFVERLPRTGVGKLLRRELIRMDQERGK
jgi:long-chain acyl-CoA synthetase